MEFEKLTFPELQTLTGWAREEGWNPGPHDAEVFWATDPDAFWGFRRNGDLIAGGALVSYDGQFGFMGLFIVRPDYRSNGLGRELWYKRRDLLLSRLDDGATIGMDGVVDMQPFYAKGGFEIAYRDERHEKIGCPFEPDSNVTPVQPSAFEAILAYDQQCFGFPRPQFLERWLQLPGTRTFQYVTEGKTRGFAVLRKADNGYKIGPLFGDSAEVAQALYEACLNAVPGEPVYLDIPMANPDAIALTQKYQTKYVFECARMYHGKTPDIPLGKVFGITTFELG